MISKITARARPAVRIPEERTYPMSKTVKQICIGTLPLWVGILVNAVISYFPIPIFLFSIIYLFLWAYLCYRACDPKASAVKQALNLCLFGLVMFLLVTYQECVRGEYWMNYAGILTQMYFLPALSAGVFLLRPFMEVLTVYSAYVVEMVLLAALCLLGCALKVKKARK